MISFDVGRDKFNFRVGAIVLDSANERILMNTRDGIDFFVLPGGRVEMGEDTITVVPGSDSQEAVSAFADNLSGKLEILPKVANKINIVFLQQADKTPQVTTVLPAGT